MPSVNKKWLVFNTYPPMLSNLKVLAFKEGAKVRYVGSKYKAFPNESSNHLQYETFYNSQHYRPYYFNGNKQNEHQALLARVLKATPEVDEDRMLDFIFFCHENLYKLIPRVKLEPVTIDHYLKESNAQPSVKNAIRKTRLRMEADGVDYNTRLDQKSLYKYTTRKSFVKVENLNYGSKCGVLEKAPRLIQGARPEFIAWVGPFFTTLQKYFAQCLNGSKGVMFTSGISNVEAANFIMQGPGHLFENDVSAWDSSVHPLWCIFEGVIAKLYGAPRLVVDLMMANVDTHGVTSQGFKYKVPGTRKSGDPFTSVFNSILNAMMHLFILCTVTGKKFDLIVKQCRMLVMGDDNLMRVPVKINFKDHCLQLGFKSTGCYRSQFYEAEYCSSILVPCSKGYCFIPKPGKMLAKFGYFVDPPLYMDPSVLLFGVVNGLSHLKFVDLYKHIFNQVGVQVLTPKQQKQIDRWLGYTDKLVLEEVQATSETIPTLLLRYQFDWSMWRTLFSSTVDHPYWQALFDRETDGDKFIY